ncbi:MAG: ribbon-helix-helix domain-containing protein [Pseudomonadota bacterium]|nr:ribbon-helix-helix domain-containing protein [Pseudomonadota bacterium]
MPDGGLCARAYHPPLKRSMTIAGHQTSISLEPIFWTALENEARRRELALSALVAEVDAARLEATRVPNLTSALRQYLFGLRPDRGSEARGTAGSAGQP